VCLVGVCVHLVLRMSMSLLRMSMSLLRMSMSLLRMSMSLLHMLKSLYACRQVSPSHSFFLGGRTPTQSAKASDAAPDQCTISYSFFVFLGTSTLQFILFTLFSVAS